MSKLGYALSLIKNITKGDWYYQESGDLWVFPSVWFGKKTKEGHEDHTCDILFREPKGSYDAAFVAAAPDMAAWIKKALPYIRGIKEGMEAPLMLQPEKYDELCSLLAEAKGEGK